MIWLWIYLSIGFLFWARARFNYELLRKRDWTQLRKNKPPVDYIQKRDWPDWTVTTAFHLVAWPILAALMILMYVHSATGWLLGKIAGG